MAPAELMLSRRNKKEREITAPKSITRHGASYSKTGKWPPAGGGCVERHRPPRVDGFFFDRSSNTRSVLFICEQVSLCCAFYPFVFCFDINKFRSYFVCLFVLWYLVLFCGI